MFGFVADFFQQLFGDIDRICLILFFVIDIIR